MDSWSVSVRYLGLTSPQVPENPSIRRFLGWLFVSPALVALAPLRNSCWRVCLIQVAISVCFVACVRLWALATFDSRSHDPTQAYTAVLTWTSTEPNVALTCACLPSLGPIFARSSKANQDASRHSFEKEPIRANQEAFGRRGNDTESLAELSSGDLAPAVLAYQLPLSRQLLDPPRRINHTPPSYTTVGSNVV